MIFSGIKKPQANAKGYDLCATEARHNAPVANRNTPNHSFEVSRHEFC